MYKKPVEACPLNLAPTTSTSLTLIIGDCIAMALLELKGFKSNHFKDLAEGSPYDHFIDGLRDKCLGKLKNSPMRNKQTDDPTIIELQNKLNKLSDEELDNTYWEIETGEFFIGEQIKELEEMRNNLISKLIIKENSKQDSVLKIIMGFCETYEKLCQKKYPEAPLPLEILKSVN